MIAEGRAELLDCIRSLAHIGGGPEDPSDTALSFEVVLMKVAMARYECLTAAERQAVMRLYETLKPLGIENEQPEMWTEEAVATATAWSSLRTVATETLQVFG
jgi:hypothetical protein